jgi:hypothetical protein
VTFLTFSGAACTHTREARAIQPFPVRTQDAVPSSATLYIHERDMHLPWDYQLRSSAQFTVVSRDRLRFHVGIVRYFEDEADTGGWTAWLVDENGEKYAPEEREVARVNRISVDWALYPYTPGDGWCPNAQPCKSRIVPGYQVYQGVADYMFHVDGLFTPARQKLTLVLRRGGMEFHYVWRFGDTTDVQNYGRTHVDDEMGTIVLPGPDTKMAGTRYEGDRWHDSGERP